MNIVLKKYVLNENIPKEEYLCDFYGDFLNTEDGNK